jgi:hypothetical protein
MSTLSVIVNGSLRPNGIVELDGPPQLPPGRVRVTLQPLTGDQPPTGRLPDAPWPDDAVSAPFDLPRPGPAKRVQPRVVAERLPEPIAGILEEAG